MKKSGRILIAADLGAEYGFVDVDGEVALVVHMHTKIIQLYMYIHMCADTAYTCIHTDTYTPTLACGHTHQHVKILH